MTNFQIQSTETTLKTSKNNEQMISIITVLKQGIQNTEVLLRIEFVLTHQLPSPHWRLFLLEGSVSAHDHYLYATLVSLKLLAEISKEFKQDAIKGPR